MMKHDKGTFMLLFLLTAHISFSFVEEFTLAFLCHCSISSDLVATQYILYQTQDWDSLSGRRDGEEVERKKEEGEEERGERGEKRRN